MGGLAPALAGVSPEDTDLPGNFNGEGECDRSGPDEKILLMTRLAKDLNHRNQKVVFAIARQQAKPVLVIC